MNGWLLLAGAIVLEIIGTGLLKLSNGFALLHWGLLSIACYAVCFIVFAATLKVIPIGVAYAIWAGAGIVAATLLGMLAFQERLSAMQLLSIGLIVIGAIGLRLTTQA